MTPQENFDKEAWLNKLKEDFGEEFINEILNKKRPERNDTEIVEEVNKLIKAYIESLKYKS